jgi:flagellin
MAIVVNSNTTAMDALGHLNRTNRGLRQTFARISSGLRINSARDDVAGLAMAENMQSDYMSLNQSVRNTNDGISVVQTAEGATNEVADMLKRMRELAVQAASETMHNNERAYVQDEFKQLTAEIDRIAQVTEFNGISLGNDGNSKLNVQVGIMNTDNDRIAINLGDLRSTTLGVDAANLNLASVTSSQAALQTIDTALNTMNQYRSDYGAVENRLSSALNNLEIYRENIKSSESRIRDADYAFETAEMNKFNIMQQAGVAILSQANNISQGALRLIG